jgi:SPP1 gp7 family putative phage head morphogenesis protein
MVRLPVKKLEVLQREKLEEDLTKDLVKFIGVMLKEKNGEERVGVVHKDKPKGTEDIIFTDERKDAYWRSFITMVTEREAELKEKAIELFKEQEKIVLENLERSVKYWRKEFRKGKESSVLPSLEQMSMMWERVFVNELQEILIEQGDYTLDFLGAGGHLDLTTDFAVEFLREYAVGMVRDINETTRTQLRETLAEGFEAGEGIDKLEDRIEEIFKKATRVRAEVIARTEALRASNFATVEAYRQSEVVSGKEWLTERDDRTCPFCEELDGKIVELDGNYYDEGDTFTLGDSKLEFEYEVAQPPLHPDCRCTTIPVLIEGKGKSKKDLTE